MSRDPSPAAAGPADDAASIVEILSLEEAGPDHWRAYTPPGGERPDIFGGQVASQCLMAAGHTIDGAHLPNSVHCYFLRRGRPDLALELHVERIRTGRTYASRRVEAVQDGKVIFTLISSFHTPEPGREFDGVSPPASPDPETLPSSLPQTSWAAPFDSRSVPPEGMEVRWWAKARGALGDDPLLHYCALLYASDMHAGGAAMRAAGLTGEGLRSKRSAGGPAVNLGSLDHSVWFHRRPCMDEWTFFDSRPVEVRDSRGLVLGTMHDRQGVHLASLSQEMFLKAPGAHP